MAVLINIPIFDTTCSKTLLPWTVHCLQDERLALNDCFEMVVARSNKEIKEHLSDHRLEEARVGMTKDALDIASDTGMPRGYVGSGLSAYDEQRVHV